ncbi:MAG: hypothetical protein ACYTG0_05350 [Planctomycetota bacterium]|jgi:hypothetical protein
MQLKLAIGLLAVLNLADPGRGPESVPESLLAAVQRQVLDEDVCDASERKGLEESACGSPAILNPRGTRAW